MSDLSSQPLVTVIIPYYQNEKGLLAASVQSIIDQSGYSNFEVIVVDDGSPTPAQSELKDIIGVSQKITVIEQENAGPGAARNQGLDCVATDTRYIAFMDSDDTWSPDFLRVAVNTLELGYDLFFTNSLREGVEHSRFEWGSQKKLDLKPDHHQLLSRPDETYEFMGDFFDYAVVRSNILSTSATIFRREVDPDLRFNPELYNGQDRLFKLSLSQKIRRVAFSAKVMVSEHKGLNIFGSSKWGTSKSLVLLSNYINLSKTILKTLTLNQQHRAIIKGQLNESRHSFVASLLHLIKHEEQIDWSLVAKTVKNDPASVLMVVPSVLKILASK